VKVSRPETDELCVRVGASPATDGRGLEVGLQRHESSDLAGPGLRYLRAHAVQLAHFVSVGTALLALNLLLLYGFRTGLHWPDPLAVGAMYILGTVLHFVYHRWITYRAQDRPLVPQGLRYGGMLIANFLILQTLVGIAARSSISPYVAVVASAGCTMVANFLLMTHVVFAPERRR
jgi:putative flippase GtrA